jgi:hypothetical protein
MIMEFLQHAYEYTSCVGAEPWQRGHICLPPISHIGTYYNVHLWLEIVDKKAAPSDLDTFNGLLPVVLQGRQD